jgi:pilus assembly protein CpaF
MVTLLLTEKGGDSKQLVFEKDEVTVGRVQGNDIVLPKGNVSKRHCRIIVQAGRFVVEDLKSTNGTYINGRKIADATSVSGSDKIYVGDFVIKVENAGFEAANQPPMVAEAGSLSTALPRRPPPPPAPGRPTGAMRAIEDDGSESALPRSSGRMTLPPPPPAGRRDTARPQPAVTDDSSDLDLAPAGAAEVDVDEEALPRPRLSVPPLKSPLPSLADDDSDEAVGESDDDIVTGNRDRPPAAGGGFQKGPAASTGSPDAVASWLRHLLESDGASAVYVSGSNVEVEREGQREPAEVPAGVSLPEALRSLASRGTPRPSGDTRVVNVMLPENARLAAIFPPIASELCATLQKLAPVGRTLPDLSASGVISPEGRELLEACLATRRNLLVGGDGRAARLLLQAVASAIPPQMRVASLVDGLTSPEGATWMRFASETRVSDIVFAAASLRPDYLIVDVTAPPLAADILTQCVLGQEGTIVSLAARSATEAVQRLAALAGPSLGGIAHVRELAATAFDLVLCASTLSDGSLRVLELGEPRTDANGELAVEPLVVWKGNARSGRFEVTGASTRLASTLSARGTDIPRALARG